MKNFITFHLLRKQVFFIYGLLTRLALYKKFAEIDDSMSRMGSNGTNNHGHVGYILNSYLSKNIQKFTYMSAGTAPIAEIKKKM